MKNSTLHITTWLILSAFLLNAGSLYADAWVKHRSKCRWYRNKWATRAWVDEVNGGLINTNFSCNDKKGSCGLAVSRCYWNDLTRTRAYAHGSDVPRPYMNADGIWRDDNRQYYKAKAYADAVVVTSCTGGTVVRSPNNPHDCYGNGFAGFNRIMLPADQTVYHITKPFIAEPVQNSRAYLTLVDQEPIYDENNHTVIIEHMSGMLKMNAQDVANDFTALTISVTYEPQSYTESEDPYNEENEYLDNLVWSSTAMLNNGRVLMDGALESSFFKVTKNDGPGSEIAVALSIDKLTIPIPENISLDDISVNLGVDGGNLGYGISKKFMVSNPTDEIVINPFFVPEEVFTFDNYPNAVSNTINIKVQLPYTQDISVTLSDINGNEVKQVYQGGVRAGEEVIIQDNLSNLKDGVYFLVTEIRNQLLVRKVLIRH